MVFGPSDPSETPPSDMCPLNNYVHPVVSNWDFKMDSDFKLEHQVPAVVRTRFYSLEMVGQGEALYLPK